VGLIIGLEELIYQGSLAAAIATRKEEMGWVV
jgi:hypothetical protein